MNLKKIYLLINILLTGLLLWMGYNIIMTWVSGKQGKSRVQTSLTNVKKTGEAILQKGKNQKHFRDIIEHDIFKTRKKAAKKVPPKKQKEEIKVTDLKLKLHGTVVGENRESFAVIQNERTREQGIYFQNDFVLGARIVRVMPNKVILNLEGNEEILVMEYESGSPPPRAVGPPKKPRLKKKVVTKKPRKKKKRRRTKP